MSGPVYQGNYNDLLTQYGHDAAKNIMQWNQFGDGWKINDTLGLIASPDMDVIANPSVGVSLDKYNSMYQDRRNLDPYQNADTGWIWNSDKGAYYWPSTPTTDIDGSRLREYARHLRPGETKESKGMFGSFSPAVSFFTGGLSDVIQGNKLGEGFLGEQGGSLFQDFLLSTGTAGLSDAIRGYQKYQDTGDIFAGIDRAIDPGGFVDTGTRKIGSLLPDEIRNISPTLGSIIGTAIYPVAGTAAGYGVGSKIKGGEDVYNYKGDIIGAAIAAAMAYAGGKVAGNFGSQTAEEAAASTTDPELAAILNDMQAATYSDYAGIGPAEYLDSVYNESQAHPGVMYTIDGPEVSPFAQPDVDAMYGNIEYAPSNPGLDYPIMDNATGLPKYSNDMYDYLIDPSTGERIYSNEVINSTPAYDMRTVDELYGDPYNVLEDNATPTNNSSLLKEALKLGMKLFGNGSEEEGTPGYTRSWFGGSGLDMDSPGYYPKRNTGRRDLGSNILKGTNLDLDKFLGPYLEDYVLSGR